MNKPDTITNYLMKITQFHDKLAIVEKKVEYAELVMLVLEADYLPDS
jgi:hypothetical protein